MNLCIYCGKQIYFRTFKSGEQCWWHIDGWEHCEPILDLKHPTFATPI